MLKHVIEKLRLLITPAAAVPSVRPWVFYGWLATAAASVLLIAWGLFTLYTNVYEALQYTHTVVSVRSQSELANINVNLFQQARDAWDAKKNLPTKRTYTRNPFAPLPQPEEPL